LLKKYRIIDIEEFMFVILDLNASFLSMSVHFLALHFVAAINNVLKGQNMNNRQ
jgi:hypothetical protein